MINGAHPRQSEHTFERLAAAARPETALFLTGVGLITVHILDDSFVQPEPGTSLVTISSAGSYRHSRLSPRRGRTLACAPGFARR
jgi:hypothetical protein